MKPILSWIQYERGKGGNDLTRTDSLSWNDKSWVVGLTVGKQAGAYDWNRLKRERLIHDTLNHQPILLVLAPDNRSFFAFSKASATDRFSLRHDTLTTSQHTYALTGRRIGTGPDLPRLPDHQEF